MYNNKGCLSILLVGATMLFLLVIMTLWTDRTLDYWCTQWSGHAVNIPIWLSFLVTFIGNGVTFIINIISEIIRLCL